MKEQSTLKGRRHASDAMGAIAATAAANPPPGLPAERLRAVAEEVRQGFPRAMSASELVIIDVDPRHIHAFWYVPVAVAEQRRAAVGADSADAPLVLRLTEAEGPAAAKFDIEVLGLQGRYYVDIWGEARRYSAELGFRCRDGSLVLLADAPAITLPPLGPAADKSWRLQPVRPPAAAEGPGPAPAPIPEPPSERAPAPIPEPASKPARAVSPRGSVAGASIAGAAVPPRFPLPPGEPAEPVPDELPVAAAPAPVGAEVAASSSAGAVSPAGGPEVTAPSLAAVASGEGGGATAPASHPVPQPPSQPGASVPATEGAAPPVPLSGEGVLPAGLAIAAVTAGAPAAPMASARGEPEPPAPPPLATSQGMDAEPVRHPFPLPPGEPGEYVPEHRLPSGGSAPSEPAAPAAPMASARGEPEPPAPPPPATFHWMDAEPVRHPFPLPPGEPGEYVPEHQLPGGGSAPSEPAAPAAAAEPGPEPPGGQEGSAEGPAPLPLENTLSLSSFVLGRETVELEINAELHIFGRTLPGRDLQLFGRKVTVHPDGSFSISRPLPNGALIVSALLAGNGHREE